MKYLIPTIFLLLACCTPLEHPGKAMARVNQEFDGKYIGLFFASYGAAGGAMHLDNGGRLYHWMSLEPGGGAADAETFTRPGGTYGIPTDESNGEMVTGYCKADITTDANDNITSIVLVADSIGKFGGSRCAEIFGQGNN